MRYARGATAAVAGAVLAAAAAVAAPPEGPAEYQAEPGWPLVIALKGDDFGYEPGFKSGAGGAFFEELAPGPGGRRFLFMAKAEGAYPVVLWGKGEVRGRVLTVTVGRPKPDPVPPAPPPAPADPLAAALGMAFAAEDPATRKADAAALAAVYRLAGRDGGTADSPDLRTAADLVKVVHAAAEQVCPLPRLGTVRGVLAADLDRTLGTAPAALDAAYRGKCKVQFARVAGLLEGLK